MEAPAAGLPVSLSTTLSGEQLPWANAAQLAHNKTKSNIAFFMNFSSPD
jgi:hypothetical protein